MLFDGYRTTKADLHIVYCIPFQYLDLSEVDLCQAPRCSFLLRAYNYGVHVRELQITIHLPSKQPNSPDTGNVSEVVGLLASMPLLMLLEVYLTSSEAGCITHIPHELSVAFRAYRTRLRHFGVSCRGTTPTAHGVRLDERLAAELVSSFPYLSSLTLHRIGSEATSTPLLGALASMQALKALKLLDVEAVNDGWANRAFMSDVQDVMLLCCDRLSPHGLEDLLSTHKRSLVHLALVNTPAAHHAVLPLPANKAKYDLPALRSLLIKSDAGHADSIVYLERFSRTPLRELTVRYAAGMTSLELYSLVAKREIKGPKELSIGLFGLKETREQDLRDICRRTMQYGVHTTIEGKSSLVESPPHSNDRVDLPLHGF